MHCSLTPCGGEEGAESFPCQSSPTLFSPPLCNVAHEGEQDLHQNRHNLHVLFLFLFLFLFFLIFVVVMRQGRRGRARKGWAQAQAGTAIGAGTIVDGGAAAARRVRV